MKTYKINEIFYSLQGEGRYTGRPVIFIRFSFCNCHCSFCDTEFNQVNFELTKEGLLQELQQFTCKKIVFTGGEPMLQLDKELVLFLKQHKYGLAIETNGTINEEEVLDELDWVCVSPKDVEYINSLKVTRGDELKVVYQKQDLKKYELMRFSYFYLQPCSMQNIPEIVEIIKQNPKWTLSLQTQKILSIQ